MYGKFKYFQALEREIEQNEDEIHELKERIQVIQSELAFYRENRSNV